MKDIDFNLEESKGNSSMIKDWCVHIKQVISEIPKDHSLEMNSLDVQSAGIPNLQRLKKNSKSNKYDIVDKNCLENPYSKIEIP